VGDVKSSSLEPESLAVSGVCSWWTDEPDPFLDAEGGQGRGSA
jgi:hypothetical protein